MIKKLLIYLLTKKIMLSSTDKCNFKTKGKKAFDSFLPFDQVVRPFGYYDKKLHST